MRKNIYEKVIAAALLKFGKLDNMDIHIFCKNIMSKLDGEKYYCYCGIYRNLCKFIKLFRNETVDNSNISLRKDFTFDSIIDKDYLLEDKNQLQTTIDDYYYDGITLKELLERFCNESFIKEYFDNLDIEKYYAEKEELLRKYKEELLNNANVLLITDEESEYNNIKNYGFKKIDWFKSQVIADNYFKEHEDELNKYHIYIRGSHPYCGFDLFKYEEELEKKEHAIKCSYLTGEKENQICYEEYFQDELTSNSWSVCSPKYNDILHSIVNVSMMKDILNKVDKKYLNASVITFEESCDKPIPKKTEDLKIQYLKRYEVPEFADEISKDLNLDVTFNEDNNYGIENYIFKNMGDYDIIIASNTYSGKILNLAKEALEQLKCSGRKMALFVTYDESSNWAIDENGEHNFDRTSEEITLKYIFVGPGIVNNGREEKKFNLVKGENADKKKVKAIIETAIEIYNDKLKEIGETGFEKTGYKTSVDYEEEYQKIKEEKEQRINSILDPIKAFNKMTSTINSYLEYKTWLEEDDKTFNIIERKDGMMTVEQVEDDKVVARITYINKGQKDTYAEFIFSYEDDNHSIDEKKRYGFYTIKHNNDLFLPEKPDENTVVKINEFEEKVEEVLHPLYSRAWNKHWENERYIEKQEEKMNEFDRLYNALLYYFKYTCNELGNISFDGFQMSKNNDGIKVTLMLGSRCVGAVTFKRSYDNISREFLVEEINKKGVLSKPQRVGYSIDGKLNEPDEKQLLIINKVRDIINDQIVPLNNQVQISDSEGSKNNISFQMLYGKKHRRC